MHEWRTWHLSVLAFRHSGAQVARRRRCPPQRQRKQAPAQRWGDMGKVSEDQEPRKERGTKTDWGKATGSVGWDWEERPGEG